MTERIDEKDLPLVDAAPTDEGRAVRNGKAIRFPLASLPPSAVVQSEIDQLKAGQAAGQIVLSTWAQLSARTGEPGVGAQVIDDAGTHTDPVVGGTVSNAGQYVWSASPAGWKWVRPDALPLKADKTALAETTEAVEATGLRGLGVYADIEQSVGLVRDESGRLRVLYAVDGGRAISYMDSNGLTRRGALDALSYAGAEAVFNDLGPAYPQFGEYFRDASGNLRVRTALGNGYDYGAPGEGAPLPPLPTTFYVVLCIGQSNMEGRGDSAFSPEVPDGVAYWWNPATSTLDHVADPIEDASTGSSLPAMCLEFWKRTGFGVILVPAAQGSSAVTQEASTGAGQGANNWSATGARRAQAASRFADCIAALDTAGICWQFGGTVCAVGETDAGQLDAAASGLTAQVYYDGYADLISYIRTQTDSPKAPFVITRTGAPLAGDTAGWQAIRAEQMKLVRALPGVFMGFTGALAFPGRGLMTDNLHYGQTGLNEMGVANGTVLAAVSPGAH